MTYKVGTLPMKAQLVVVQGKPEGKMIPLAMLATIRETKSPQTVHRLDGKQSIAITAKV